MNIYQLLSRIISNKKFELSPSLFTQKDREKLDENDRNIFDILKDISSLGREIHNFGVVFHPMFVMANGQRTFSVDDLTDDDYNLLKSIDFDKVPLSLRTLVADILWTQKKEFAVSKIAAEAYWELFLLWYDDSNAIGALDMIRRDVCISRQTKQNTLYSRICSWFDDFLLNDSANSDDFFSLRIMKLFVEQKDYNISPLFSVIDNIIRINNDNPLKIEQSYELKTRCFHKMKKEDVINNNLSLAKYYVDFAGKIVQENSQDAIRAVNFFQKAIALYRNNGNPQQAEKVHKRLVMVQK